MKVQLIKQMDEATAEDVASVVQMDWTEEKKNLLIKLLIGEYYGGK